MSVGVGVSVGWRCGCVMEGMGWVGLTCGLGGYLDYFIFRISRLKEVRELKREEEIQSADVMFWIVRCLYATVSCFHLHASARIFDLGSHLPVSTSPGQPAISKPQDSQNHEREFFAKSHH